MIDEMSKSSSQAAMPGDVLSFQPWTPTDAQARAEPAPETPSR